MRKNIVRLMVKCSYVLFGSFILFKKCHFIERSFKLTAAVTSISDDRYNRELFIYYHSCLNIHMCGTLYEGKRDKHVFMKIVIKKESLLTCLLQSFCRIRIRSFGQLRPHFRCKQIIKNMMCFPHSWI